MNIFNRIQLAIHDENYALRPHAVSHMVSDGFDENNIVEAVENRKIFRTLY